MRNTIILGVITTVLLTAAIAMLLVGFNTPAQKQKEVTRINYQLNSNFSQQAYGQSKTEDTITPIIFPQLSNTINGSYTYKFVPKTEISDTKTSLKIDAIVSNGNLWQKTVVLVPEQETTGSFTIDFPLDLTSFMSLRDTINTEIGTKSESLKVTLQAAVQVEAVSETGTIQDTLNQACSFSLSSLFMEWQPPFDLTQKGYQSGIFYEQLGNFGYTVNLKPNSLYTAAVLKSDPPAEIKLHKLSVSNSYDAEKIDRLDMSFHYDLTADQPVNEVEHQVDITAVLSNADGPQLELTLLPRRYFYSDFEYTVPLDTDLIYDTIDRLGETGNDFVLAVTAVVNTGAQTAGKTINKTVTDAVTLEFRPGSVVWPSKTDTLLSDSIKETVTQKNSTRSSIFTASYGLWGFVLALLLWTWWTYREEKRSKQVLSTKWEEVKQIVEKHKGIITDVVALPPEETSDKLVFMSSLEDLVKLSDNLLKPVLHLSSYSMHQYLVIDGITRYVYILSENTGEVKV